MKSLMPIEIAYLVDAYSITSTHSIEWKQLMENDNQKSNFSVDEMLLSKRYSRFGLVGCAVLAQLNKLKIFNTTKGTQIVQNIENVLNNKDIENEDLFNHTRLWYTGQLYPGDVELNNEAFVKYIYNECTK